MTNIAIDISQTAHVGSGVARYMTNLVKALAQYDSKHTYTFFYASLRKKMNPSIVKLIKPPHTLKILKLPPTLFEFLHNRARMLPIEAFIGSHDIVVSSDWTQPKTNAKKVTIVHDLVYLKYPQTLHPKILEVQKRRMALVKKEVDIIITDSQSTKQDLVDLLQIDEKKINVVYPAVEVQKPTVEDLKHMYTKYKILNTKYILSVGKLEPRKNIPRLIRAFHEANLKDTQLLIVGPSGWNTKSQNAIRKPTDKIPDAVRFLGFIPDEDLYALYSNALFFVYPSLYEGFGYPLIEAMALDCPIATSNTSSMKEIALECGLLFDPESQNEITENILNLYNNKELRSDLIKKGKSKSMEFNQSAFARKFLQSIK